jgi:hypothetical protein
VSPDVHAAYNRRIDAEVLLHGTSAAVLDRGASLDDDPSDPGGATNMGITLATGSGPIIPILVTCRSKT